MPDTIKNLCLRHERERESKSPHADIRRRFFAFRIGSESQRNDILR